MGSPTTQLQVVFHDQDAEIIKLAHHSDVSLSRYINTVMLEHISSNEVQKTIGAIRLSDLSVKDAVLAAIDGATLSDDKVDLLIEALDRFDPKALNTTKPPRKAALKSIPEGATRSPQLMN